MSFFEQFLVGTTKISSLERGRGGGVGGRLDHGIGHYDIYVIPNFSFIIQFPIVDHLLDNVCYTRYLFHFSLSRINAFVELFLNIM